MRQTLPNVRLFAGLAGLFMFASHDRQDSAMITGHIAHKEYHHV
jgi:hypothetical protein